MHEYIIFIKNKFTPLKLVEARLSVSSDVASVLRYTANTMCCNVALT